MYIVVHKFKDLQDDNHIYNVGDKFPFDDKKISDERYDQLSSTDNKIGKILIKKVSIEGQTTNLENDNTDSNKEVSNANLKLKGRKLKQ